MNEPLAVRSLTPPPELLLALRRGSTLLFDNLGIPIDVTSIHQHYAARIGKHSLALTSDESTQAVLDYIQVDPALMTALLDYLKSHKETIHASDR